MNDDDDDVTPFGFADEPNDRPRSEEPGDDGTLPRKHRRASPGPPDLGNDILDRPAPPAGVSWWVAPIALLGAGLLLCLVPVAVVAVKSGVETAVTLMLVTAIAVVVQVVMVTALLTLVGQLFGIEYGPVGQAVLKLAAVVAVVDGLTGLLLLTGSPCTLMMAAFLGAGVFHYLFRLAIHETLVSVAGMVFAAFLLNGVVIAFLVQRAMLK